MPFIEDVILSTTRKKALIIPGNSDLILGCGFSRRARLARRAGGARRRHDHRNGGDDALRLHDRLVGGHAHGGRPGDRPLPPAQGVRRAADRPAGDAERARRSRPRSGSALALTLRMARALDNRASPHEDALVRLGAPIGKYWICKRAPAHAYEAMECIGGSGAMEDSPMPRLYREAPINAIWEGSGNVQCLDVLRAIRRSPETLDAYFGEVEGARGENRALDAHVATLKDDMRDLQDFEERARDLCDRLALGLMAATMVKAAPAANANAFCRSRLETRGQHNWGRCRAGSISRRSSNARRRGEALRGPRPRDRPLSHCQGRLKSTISARPSSR